MLQDLQVKGFKIFRDLQLTDISRVTLVGGKNNVGKTSLLEAIFLFYDTADPGMFFRHLGWRGVDAPLTDAEALFSPLFLGFNTKNGISFKVQDGIYEAKMSINSSFLQKAVSIDVSSVGKSVIPLQTDALTATSYYMNIHYEIFGGGQEDVAVVLRKTPTSVNIQLEPHPVTIIPSGMLQKVVLFPLRLKTNPGEDVARFSELDVNRKIDRVVDFLKIIEPQLVGLTSVTPLNQNPAVYADIQGMDRKVPVALLGDGMSKLLSIILAIATTNNGIVLIDEIDAGIHHTVLPKVWEGIFKAAKDFNCQIIATTHSYECLQAAHDGSSKAGTEKDFSYIRLESHENNIIAKQYSRDILGAALEHGWEVR